MTLALASRVTSPDNHVTDRSHSPLVLTGNTSVKGNVITNPPKPDTAGTTPTTGLPGLPPRQRIVAAASELFYRHGIRAVGVDAVAEAAGTNKMTLYRHFASKDDLVAECLRRLGQEMEAGWTELAAGHPGDARAQLLAWLKRVASRLQDPQDRGCALVNAAIELPDKHHPARQVIEAVKAAARGHLIRLGREASLSQPEQLADELILLVEGARVCAQSMGPQGPCGRLETMGAALIDAHA
jgi:AcrR family transcriptional regulator